MIGPEGHAEHVGDDLLLDPLVLELAREVEEHLPRDLRQGGPHTSGGRELRDEDHRLLHDRVDEELSVHATFPP